MIDLTLLPSAISGLKAATDIALGLVKANTAVEVNARVNDLLRALYAAHADALSAQAAQLELKDEIRELHDQLTKFSKFETESKRYRLVTPWNGCLVYALKESMSSGDPPHYICTSCYEETKKSILNQMEGKNGFTFYVCPVCKSQIPTESCGQVAAEYAPD